MEDKREEEEEVMFVNMAREVEEDSEEEEEVQGGATTSDKEMGDEIKRTQVAVDECYRRWARRAGISIEVTEERLLTEEELDSLSEQLGVGAGARAKRRREIEKMSIMEMEMEVEEVQEKIKKGKSRGVDRLPLMLTFLCLTGKMAEGFTAYDCSNRATLWNRTLCWNMCAIMGKEGEVETTVYGEIVQIKQDRMIPVFKCVVIETIVFQYCGHFSAAGVTRYIRFKETKTVEAWECRQARRNGKVVINGRTFQAKLGSTASHTMFLSGGWMTKATVRSGSSASPTYKPWGDRQLKGCTRLRSGRNMQG